MCHSWEKLRYHSHNDSWERITSFVPWVTHGLELRAFIARKMAKSMYNMRPYIGKKNTSFASKGYSCNYSPVYTGTLNRFQSGFKLV